VQIQRELDRIRKKEEALAKIAAADEKRRAEIRRVSEKREEKVCARCVCVCACLCVCVGRGR
jgi:hypothetical protein